MTRKKKVTYEGRPQTGEDLERTTYLLKRLRERRPCKEGEHTFELDPFFNNSIRCTTCARSRNVPPIAPTPAFKKGDIIAPIEQRRYRIDKVVPDDRPDSVTFGQPLAEMTMIADDRGRPCNHPQLGGPCYLGDKVVITPAPLPANALRSYDLKDASKWLDELAHDGGMPVSMPIRKAAALLLEFLHDRKG